MTGQRGLFVVGGLVLVACVAAMLFARGPVTWAADVEILPQEQGSAATVPMAEVTQLQGRRVEGRVIYEDDQRIDLQQPGGSVTGYAKTILRPEIRRFSISEMDWAEREGDLRQNGALDGRDPSLELLKALNAYQRGLVLAADPKDRARLDAKVKAVQQLQDAWHAESVQRQDLEIMTQQAELLKVQQQLTQEKLAALEAQELELGRLRNAVARLQADNRDLATFVDNMGAAVETLQQDMDDLQDLDRLYASVEVVAQLRADHNALARQVQQLQQRITRGY